MSAWLINQEDIWIGFVLVAAGPPAVAVIPFTNILGGNMTNWKITYLDCMGHLSVTYFSGDISSIGSFYPPNSMGTNSIIKIEKVA